MGFTAAELDELSNVFYNPISAEQLLSSAGVDRAAFPRAARNSLAWWRAVDESLPDGMHRQVLDRAAEQYRANTVFRGGRPVAPPPATPARPVRTPSPAPVRPSVSASLPAGPPPLARTEIEALVSSFPTERPARAVAQEAGFRAGFLPGWSNAYLWWGEIARLVNVGALVDGRSRLLAAAASLSHLAETEADRG